MTETTESHDRESRPRRRWVRYGVVIAGVVSIVGVLAGLKFCQISTLIAKGKEMERAGPPPEAVGSAVAQSVTWETALSAVGSVTGAESVAVSNDAPGIVQRIQFESGEVARRGRPLVQLDAGTERAQLASARARRDLARTSAERSRALFRAGAIAREQLDRSQTELETASSELSTLEEQIERKVVRAPFTGRLGIRAVNVGQYLAAGSTITTLEAIDGLYVDFALPQEQLGRLSVGLPVRIVLEGTSEAVDGRIAAIDPAVDPRTRNLRLRASVPATRGGLRSGMYVRVAVVLPDRANVVIVPATAIVRAAYGDSVFVIEPKPPGEPGMIATPDGKPVKIARQRFVRVGSSRGDFVAIDQGLEAGAEVVTAGAFKLRNGSPVVVDNARTARPELDPRPPNR